MNIAIIDDLRTDSERLAELLRAYMDRHHLHAGQIDLFSSGEMFLSTFTAGRYDLIFLDIYMDGITGMETAKKLRKTDRDCKIIFITTSPEFAVESYDVEAAFYLLKPITPDGVFTALDRCGFQSDERFRSVEVMTPIGKMVLPVYEVSYTEYVKRRILVHFKNGRQLELSMRQQDLSALLLQFSCFCDCIRGILVNFEDVEKLSEDHFLLKSGIRIPISRLKYREVREHFLEYSYSMVRGGHYDRTSF